MTGRRKRHLTAEDARLWELVRSTARPIHPGTPEAVPQKPEAAPKTSAAQPPPAAPRPPPPAVKPEPGSLDRRTRSRLARGVLEVDARIDLHGMTQAVAHGRLRGFLEDAQARGARLVLVITGKGRADAESGEGGRGVLKRSVPDWLGSLEFRHLVAGLDEAGRRHGAGGALYVHIRRKRLHR